MNIKSIEKPEVNTVVLTVEVSKEEFEAAQEQAYRKNVGKMNVPGFRKGKAPRKMLEKLYGTSVFYEDAVNISYPKAYDAAIDESGIHPIDQADVDINTISEEGYSFTAKVTTRPEVKLGKYKGLKATMPEIVVADAEIDEELKKLLERNSRLQSVERAVQDGDTITFDYEGFKDGVPFEGGQAEKFALKIGSGRFIPGFEEQTIGHTIGEDFDVNVSFPEEYHAPELAGAAVVFKCHIHEIKESVSPELDDEFAKDVSEFDTLEEFKKSISERIEHSKFHEAEHVFEDELLDQVIADMDVVVPDVMVERQLEELIQDMRYRLSRQRLDFETYLTITGSTLEDFKNEKKPDALRQVKASLAFDAIAKAEALEVTEDELNAEYLKIAESYKMDMDRIKQSIPSSALKNDMLSMKASVLVKTSSEGYVEHDCH